MWETCIYWRFLTRTELKWFLLLKKWVCQYRRQGEGWPRCPCTNLHHLETWSYTLEQDQWRDQIKDDETIKKEVSSLMWQTRLLSSWLKEVTGPAREVGPECCSRVEERWVAGIIVVVVGLYWAGMEHTKGWYRPAKGLVRQQVELPR